jgi:hypothetical protein
VVRSTMWRATEGEAWPDSGRGRLAPALERRVQVARCARRCHATRPTRRGEGGG